MLLSVIGLIDNIGNHVAGTKAETVINISRSEKVLDAISSLPAKESARLDSGIREAMNRMRATGDSAEYRLRTNTISITIIANYNSTKADQRAVIETVRAKIEAERSNNDTPIAIFSWNYGMVLLNLDLWCRQTDPGSLLYNRLEFCGATCRQFPGRAQYGVTHSSIWAVQVQVHLVLMLRVQPRCDMLCLAGVQT